MINLDCVKRKFVSWVSVDVNVNTGVDLEWGIKNLVSQRTFGIFMGWTKFTESFGVIRESLREKCRIID